MQNGTVPSEVLTGQEPAVSMVEAVFSDQSRQKQDESKDQDQASLMQPREQTKKVKKGKLKKNADRGRDAQGDEPHSKSATVQEVRVGATVCVDINFSHV